MEKKANYVVGIGASAGGLDAINDLFENMPGDTGFTFIIVQHISPDHKSLMGELLGKHTLMKVYEAEEGMVIKPNSIYLIPSKKFMTIKFSRLYLQDKVKTNLPNNAIDVFFESLGEEYKEKAVGVILSGTGSDGTKGIETIKKNGGIVVIQDPITAGFDGMPNSAISTGVADLILAPESMGIELIQFLDESSFLRSLHMDTQREEFMLRDILTLIRKETGLDFSYYKRPTLLRRLAKRLSELGITNFQTYLDLLNNNNEELRVISQEFLINVTQFFRDPEAFDLLKDTVIPAIMQGKNPDETVKAWSIACSSGEEAYSFAILFREYMESNRMLDVNVKIFATDIDKDSLEIASRGYYPKSIYKDITPERLKKYFIAEESAYKVHPDIRKMVVFSYHDIVKDPPFSRIDLLSCRNMLIYINAERQKEILKKMHFAINRDGFLLLGPSEHIGPAKNAMEEIDKKWKLYKCLSKTRLPDVDSMFIPLEKKYVPISEPISKIKNPLNHLPEIFKDTLLEEYKVAGIFIDLNFDVKQAIGSYKNFIDLPENSLNFNLLKLVNTDLSVAISLSVRKAIKDNVKVTMKRVKVHDEKGDRNITVIVKPYLHQKDYTQQFLFVVLNEEDNVIHLTTKSSFQGDDTALHHISELEKELKETRENLQAVIEEVETANEELQSTNEEMVSANEEMQSTNEELQSLNEELHTVSAEHQLKIKELSELNDDMNNYFLNSDIGQILIDQRLIIRKFSPIATRMINLIDSDINRSIIDITTRFKNFDFVDDIKSVMERGEPIEREVVLRNGAIYLIRITQYIKQDKTVDGVVVNFIDISELKKLNSLVEAVFNASSSGITALKACRDKSNDIVDFEFIAANSQAELFLNAKDKSLPGKGLLKYFPEIYDLYFGSYKNVIETGNSFHFDLYDEVNYKWLEVTLIKMLDGVVSTFTDITEKRKAFELIKENYSESQRTSNQMSSLNQQLEQSNMDLLQFASVASHDLKEPLRKIQTFSNILQGKIKDKLTDDEINYFDKIITSSARMQKLIEDILVMAKLSNKESQMKEVDLVTLINSIKDDLEVSFDENKAILDVKPLPIINAIPGQMHQLFLNLINNSLKFNKSPNPIITITPSHLSDKEMSDLKIDDSKYMCISVKDNGIGFDEQYTNKIFEVFQRLHGNAYPGTGIGLAICKKIVENHSGFIIATSQLNNGSEFKIVLPSSLIAKG